MCGIFAIWDQNNTVNKNALIRATKTLYSRGPDDSGYHIELNVGLGHRRLSILDLENGRQPITNDSGSIWITYNGEIYNFLKLKKELLDKGYNFKTNTDTEVLLKLYEEYGADCISRLDGMFAFVIWDKRKAAMFVGRDRMGQKPIYYYNNDGQLIISSEIKAIISYLDLSLNINPEALNYYITLGYIPSPISIYNEINKLKPAHYFIANDKGINFNKYWAPNFNIINNQKNDEYFSDCKNVISRLLKKSIKKRMISDVPIGVLLSGGIDSSAIVAYLSQISNSTINTFSIGSNRNEFNESESARVVADKFKTVHNEFFVDIDVVKIMSDVIEGFDEPFADISALPTYYVSKLAGSKVKVVLSGDGGDELFAGYPWYKSLRDSTYFSSQSERIVQYFASFAHNYWNENWRGKDRLFYLKTKYFSDKYSYNKNRFSKKSRGKYFKNDFLEFIGFDISVDNVNNAAKKAERLDLVSMMQYADLMTYLPDQLLVKVDRMSMLHSLEVRSPFLDHKLIEYLLTIPSYFKLKGNNSKFILKDIIKPLLPEEIIKRPKKGFGIPMKDWLKSELYDYASDILLGETSRKRGYYNIKNVSALLKSHRENKLDSKISTNQIWTLLYLESWFQKYT